MERFSHGRVYVKGLPPEWTWWEVKYWLTHQLHLPEPSWIHIHPRAPGADVVSAFLHWHAPTPGQLTTYVEHMCGKYLSHRQTWAEVAQDNFVPQRHQPQGRPQPPEPYDEAAWLKDLQHVAARHKAFVGALG